MKSRRLWQCGICPTGQERRQYGKTEQVNGQEVIIRLYLSSRELLTQSGFSGLGIHRIPEIRWQKRTPLFRRFPNTIDASKIYRIQVKPSPPGPV
ncbi:MAG: hypothetical protein NTZ39_04420 [Methanoregula sp.]|nr:hypothetical protein [Methanoregula sp.]